MKKNICLLIVGLLVSTFAQADVLGGWEVTGVDVADGTGIDEGVSPFRFTAGTLGANISDAKLSLGSGVGGTTSADQYGFKVPGAPTSTTLAQAITANEYLELSITVASGFQLNLTDITMNGDTSGTGADDVAWMSSIAGYTAGNELASLSGRQAVTTGALDTDASGWGAPIDLSGASYQGITGTTTFRLYGWNVGSGAGTTMIRNLGGEDIVINGTVTAVPEPATLAFFALGIAGAFFMRRRVK